MLDYLGYEGEVLRVYVNDNIEKNIVKARVYVNDNIEKNIVKAFERLVPNEQCRPAGDAAYARQMADKCFGVNETRLATKRLGGLFSVGRVQTPTLGLVVNRDEAIENHVTRKYYELTATGGCADASGAPVFKFKPDKDMLAGEKHGVNETRLATKRLGGLFSVGRVQTPTLGLVVNRDEAIENHVTRKYYELTATGGCADASGAPVFKFKPDKDMLAGEKHVFDRDVLDVIKAKLNGSCMSFSTVISKKGENPPLPYNLTVLLSDMSRRYGNHVTRKYYELTATGGCADASGAPVFKFKPDKDMLAGEKHVFDRDVLDVIKAKLNGSCMSFSTVISKKGENPPLPYNLTVLLSDMSRRYGFSASKTQQITQDLRDKYKAITYNRSDSQYLKEEHFAQAPVVLAQAMENVGATWPLDYSIHSKAFNEKNVTAHHGIIPQEVSAPVADMTGDEAKVYTAIVERYAMQFLPPATYDVSTSQGDNL